MRRTRTNVEGTSTASFRCPGDPRRGPDRRRAGPGLRPLRRAGRAIHPATGCTTRSTDASSELLGESLAADGVTLKLGLRATRVRAGEGDGRRARDRARRRADTVEGHEILLAIGRDFPLDGLGLETVGIAPKDGRLQPDDRLRVADGVYAAGDVAGPEMHTHLGHYNGEAAARIALGDTVYRPFLDAIPRATYTDPETAPVGPLLEQAKEGGIDAGEYTQDIATSSKGYTAEAKGHVTIVVDRPDAASSGHSWPALPCRRRSTCVLAIRADVPLDVLCRHHPRPRRSRASSARPSSRPIATCRRRIEP